MEEKDLINSIKQLKNIKPNKEWAVLLKSQILAEKKIFSTPEIKAQSVSFVEVLSSLFFHGKPAHAYAAALLVVVGVFSFSQFTALSDQTEILKQSAVSLSNKINNLAQVTNQGNKDSISLAINEVKEKVVQLEKTLKDSPNKDREVIKGIVSSLKTLASVPGTDISKNSEINSLYQTIVESQIADLEKTTLTEEQKITLVEIKDLFNQGKYADALEKILLIDNEKVESRK